MSDFVFKEKSPLDGFHRDYFGVTVAKVCNRAIVSIATPRAGETDLGEMISSTFGIDLPTPGNSTVSDHRNARFLGLAIDQFFVVFDDPGSLPDKVISDDLGGTAYFVDQSDSWVVISMSGERVRDTLERICPIDLDRSVFSEGRVARTSMEHLATIIIREGEDSFLLMSPRSSAHSFLESLQTSVLNTL